MEATTPSPSFLKVAVYPKVENVDTLLGLGLNAGVEAGAFEAAGGAVDFANLSPDGKGYSGQLGAQVPGIPNLPADVYVGVGYTNQVEYRTLTEEQWDRLNNMKLGGY